MDNLDNKIRDFSNYLLDLGFLNGLNYSEFCKKFKEINQTNMISSELEDMNLNIDSIYFKDNALKAIVEFYNSMTEDKKKLFAMNIFTKYTKKKEEEMNKDNSQSDKNLNSKNTEYIIESIQSFNIFGIKQEDKSKEKPKTKQKKEDDSNKDNLSFSNFMNKRKQKNYNSEKKRNNSFALKKNKNLKEEESKDNRANLNENCTFRPKINRPNERRNDSKENTISVFDKLYKNKQSTKKKEINDIIKERDKENIFQPNKEKNNKIKKKLSRKNFDERLKKIEDNKKEKEEKRKKDEEKEFKEKFPFKPKRQNTFNKSFKKEKNNTVPNENLYQRLYDENRKMRDKYEENLKKMMKDIKDRANHPIVRHNNTNYISKMKREYRKKENERYIKKNISFDNQSKKSIPITLYRMEEKKDDDKRYEFKRIEELYEEYKKLKNQIILKEDQIKDEDNNLNVEKENQTENNNNEKEKEIINGDKENMTENIFNENKKEIVNNDNKETVTDKKDDDDNKNYNNIDIKVEDKNEETNN